MRVLLAIVLTGCARVPDYPGPAERRTVFSDVVGASYVVDVYPAPDPSLPSDPVYVVGGDGLGAAVAGRALEVGWAVTVVDVGYPDGQPLQQRLRDLTWVDEPDSLLPSGGGEAFATFLTDELVPALETDPDATERRWLLGHGLGALFASHAALAQSPITPRFDVVLAASPDLYRDGGAVLDRADEVVARGTLPVALLLSYGELEPVGVAGYTRALAEALAEGQPRGLALRQIAIDDAVHAATALPTWEEGLSWLLDAP